MRIAIIGLVSLGFILGCGSERLDDFDARAETLCQNVTNENWHSARWGSQSSHDVCMLDTLWMLETDKGHPIRPCTVGGLPAACKYLPDNDQIGLMINFGGAVAPWVDIHPDDVAKVSEHIVMH